MSELEYYKDLPQIPEEDDREPEQPRPVLEDLRSMRKYPIPDYPMFIGRDRKGAICIPVPAVSRKHTKIFERDNVYYVQDLGSINGTYLNDKRILDPVELKDGDRIKVAVTRQHPRGAKEYIFKHPTVENQDRDDVIDDVLAIGSGLRDDPDRKKVLLRDCIFTLSKRSMMFRAEAGQRVALSKIHISHRLLNFMSLTPLRIRDSLMFTIAHPRLKDSLKFTIRITNVKQVTPSGVQEHKAEIVKYSNKHKEIFDNMIKQSQLIDYVTCQFKE